MYLKIVLIIVNINKDENKSFISHQFSLKNDPPPHFLENYFAEVKIKNDHMIDKMEDRVKHTDTRYRYKFYLKSDYKNMPSTSTTMF